MSIQTSVLEALLQIQPQLHPQIYFKSSLTALSHAIEDQVLAGDERPLVIASFQRERFYRQETHRYSRISELTDQVYVLAAPETDFSNRSDRYEMVAFDSTDALSQEWHLVVLGQKYATCLVCREREALTPSDRFAPPYVASAGQLQVDQIRRFEGIWSFDREVGQTAATLMLERILIYRPELADKIARAKEQFLGDLPSGFQGANPGPFAERLVTYLQAGQYKLLKAYRSISIQERKERLINSIVGTIRRSLNLDEILQVATVELGQALQVCRCLIYRCKENDQTALIQAEFLNKEVKPLLGSSWILGQNPLIQEAIRTREPVSLEDAVTDARAAASPLATLVKDWQIHSWLLVPVFYQERLLGMIELHHCGCDPHRWGEHEISLVNAIADQIGVALIQAESYANLEDLNQQLEALDRTRSNLVAITGHELRTPLSTIQVCLESLASEPDMPGELRQVMLESALSDAERMRKLIQDFLTLSQLESGRVEWHLESLPIKECVDLALSSVRARQPMDQLPQITTDMPAELPLVRADGEWLVEVLSKLVDNACKFTESKGRVTIQAHPNGNQMMQVTVADTGRGIEPSRLERVFDRFYQEEGALRRSTGGTGLGLAICRQIVTGLGGKIWAESSGRGQGSEFHFTIPMITEVKTEIKEKRTERRKSKR